MTCLFKYFVLQIRPELDKLSITTLSLRQSVCLIAFLLIFEAIFVKRKGIEKLTQKFIRTQY